MDKGKSKSLLEGHRDKIGAHVQFVTGHNFLGYQQNKIDGITPSRCRACGEGIEDSEHIATLCDALWSLRQECDFAPVASLPMTWTVKQISRFLSTPQVKDLLQPRGGKED